MAASPSSSTTATFMNQTEALGKELSRSTLSFGATSVPIGFDFLPSDKDLVLHYLFKKLNGLPLPSDSTIPYCNLYGPESKEPWEIWKSHGGGSREKKIMFFFTDLKKRNPNNARYDRHIGESGGNWHGHDRGTLAENLGIQYLVKNFQYQNPNKKAQHGAWTLREYSLIAKNSGQPPSLVICRLMNRKKGELKDSDEASGSVLVCPKQNKKRPLDDQQKQGAAAHIKVGRAPKRTKVDKSSCSASTVTATAVNSPTFSAATPSENAPDHLLELEQEAAGDSQSAENTLLDPDAFATADDNCLMSNDENYKLSCLTKSMAIATVNAPNFSPACHGDINASEALQLEQGAAIYNQSDEIFMLNIDDLVADDDNGHFTVDEQLSAQTPVLNIQPINGFVLQETEEDEYVQSIIRGFLFEEKTPTLLQSQQN